MTRQRGKTRQFSVARTLFAVHHDAALLQQLMEESGGEFRGIFDGQSFVRARIVERHVAPQRQRGRAGLAVDENLASGAGRRGDHAIVDVIVVGEGRDADERVLPGAVRGQNVHEHDIVVDGKRGHRSAIRQTRSS